MKFVFIRDDRIGHLAGNTDLFLRRIQLGTTSNKNYIGIATINPANKQLLKMFKRRIKIIQIPKLKIIQALIHKMKLLLPLDINEYLEFNTTIEPVIKFTKEEEENGEKTLRNIGVDNWFICFNARDSSYLNNLYKKERKNLDFRNANITNYLDAVKYITKKGGFALRTGSIVEQTLKIDNPKIIDYSSKYRNDFMDIYLHSKCKFYLGDSGGLSQVAQLFNKPVAWANLALFMFPPYTEKDLFITKKVWSDTKGRFLAFKDIINSEIFNYVTTEQFENANLKLIENTPEEILDLTIEMNEKLDGKKYSEEDKALQQKFRSLFTPKHHCYGFCSRIGTEFLKKNKWLLE